MRQKRETKKNTNSKFPISRIYADWMISCIAYSVYGILRVISFWNAQCAFTAIAFSRYNDDNIDWIETHFKYYVGTSYMECAESFFILPHFMNFLLNSWNSGKLRVTRTSSESEWKRIRRNNLNNECKMHEMLVLNRNNVRKCEITPARYKATDQHILLVGTNETFTISIHCYCWIIS